MENLKSFGLNQKTIDAFESWRLKNENTHQVLARVLKGHRAHLEVVTEHGVFQAIPAPRMQRLDASAWPVPGDWVIVTQREHEDKVIFHHILERTSCFSRKVAGRRSDEQVIASNIDYIFIVTSCNKEFNLQRIQRYLLATWNSGATPLVVLSKVDLQENWKEYQEKLESVASGCRIIPTSVYHHQGIKELQDLVTPGITVAFVGSSGVGKSSLINAFLGEEFLTVHTHSHEKDKGRHTTTRRELLSLPQGGAVLDTPGMREFMLFEKEEKDSFFEDIENLALKCKFSDCTHQTEPGCALQEALEKGELDAERFKAFLRLQRTSQKGPKIKEKCYGVGRNFVPPKRRHLFQKASENF